MQKQNTCNQFLMQNNICVIVIPSQYICPATFIAIILSEYFEDTLFCSCLCAFPFRFETITDTMVPCYCSCYKLSKGVQPINQIHTRFETRDSIYEVRESKQYLKQAIKKKPLNHAFSRTIKCVLT